MLNWMMILSLPFQVLNKEYYALQNSSEKQLVELESKCKEQGKKLEIYEKLEQELDDVIMQAAERKDTNKFMIFQDLRFLELSAKRATYMYTANPLLSHPSQINLPL